MMSIRKRNAAAKHLRVVGEHYDEQAGSYDVLGKAKSAPEDSRIHARQRARDLRRDAMHCRMLANELEIK
jgi:hypothetical protein